MFPNISISNTDSLTNINNDNLNNNCCPDNGLKTDKHLKDLIESHAKTVIVTKHLCVPCPRLYSDIFGTVLIVCNDISHKNNRYSKDAKVDNTIRQLLNKGGSK